MDMRSANWPKRKGDGGVPSQGGGGLENWTVNLNRIGRIDQLVGNGS